MERMKPGTRVQRSDYALRRDIEDACEYVSWSPQGAKARARLAARRAERGTVDADLGPHPVTRANGYRVRWDDGRASECMDDMIEPASWGLGTPAPHA